jgi:hypothetical protein
MTPTAVTPASRRDRSTTSTPDSDSRRAPTARPSSLRSARTPRAAQPPSASRASARVERTTRPAPATRAATTRAATTRAATAAPRAGVKQPPRAKASSRSTSKQAPKRSPQRASSARSAAHRPSIRTSATPRARRRVSGPAGGVASLAVAGGYGTVALPARTRRRPSPALPRPRIQLPRPRLPHVQLPSPIAVARGAVAFVASLPESSLLDRVIRGRIWIPLLGVLLVGIVGLQVENLKLNAGLGGAIEQTTNLQSRNDWLRDDVAQLSDPQRIEGIAARHDMLMAPPSVTKFLGVGGTPSSGSVGAAIAGIHAPGSTYFASPAGTLSAADAAAAPGSTTAPATAG